MPHSITPTTSRSPCTYTFRPSHEQFLNLIDQWLIYDENPKAALEVVDYMVAQGLPPEVIKQAQKMIDDYNAKNGS